ncbi:MAG TPA: hypothetical protein VGY99_19040, partial [Candidatus Binataceae bacterium]|nr:hypothetical protein [Candidatus Binataceae bacterium]
LSAPPRPVSRVMTRIKRDGQVRRLVGQMRRLAPYVDDPRFAPLLRTFAEVTLLIERSYAKLKDVDVTADSGELRGSLDTFRRLAETQRGLARELGLSPTVAATMTKPVKVLDLESIRSANEED